MPRVFISYAHEDGSKARAIASALQRLSHEVWIDDRVQSGSEYSREIESALNEADAVLVLWSRSSVESAWVRDEAAEGRDSGRLVAALLDDCRPPIGFRQFQATSLSGWSGRGTPKQLEALLSAIRSKVGLPTEHEKAATPPPEQNRRWRLPLIAGAAALIVAAAAVYFVRDRTSSPPQRQTIGLLPFTADGSDPEARKLASAAHDSVAHTLSQGAFAITVLDSLPKQADPKADYLITGTVSSMADGYLATVNMRDAGRKIVVFSRQFKSPRERAGEFPELIGAQVASQLSWTAPLLALERRHPSDPAIVAALLQSSTTGDSTDVDALRDYETARRLAASAPNSPLAQNSLAFYTAFALEQIPMDQRASAVAVARRAADRTLEIAPDYGSGHVPWCLLHSSVQLIECEDRLRKAMRLDPDDPFAGWFLGRLLNNVGRNAEAAQLATLSLAHDPYMPLKIGQALRMQEVTGHTEDAEQLYRQSLTWWPDNGAINWYRFSGMMLRGDFGAMERFGRMSPGGSVPSPPLLAAINRKSLSSVKQSCIQPSDNDALPCMLSLADLGDLDGAYRLSETVYPSIVGRTPADEERIWLKQPSNYVTAFITAPAAAALRRDSRFVDLARRVGLLDYWRSGRRPDFCRERPEPICAKLLPAR